MDVETRVREIFEISSLAQKVEKLKELFFEIYPDGNLLNKEKEGLFNWPLMAILFGKGDDLVYVGQAMYDVKLDEDVLMGLCHDDEFVAKYKPLFNEAVIWVAVRVKGGRVQGTELEGRLSKLEGRLSKLLNEGFNLGEFQRRISLNQRFKYDRDLYGEKVYDLKDGERGRRERKMVWEVKGGLPF